MVLGRCCLILFAVVCAGLGCSESGGATGDQGGAGSSGLSASGGSGGTGDSGLGGIYVEPADSVDINALPTSVPTVRLELTDANRALLDGNPYDGPDVPGAFTDEQGLRTEPVDVNFRGAYGLQTLIGNSAPQRNWKLKFPKEQKYRGHREWNFNYEPHLRHALAYDLMHFAGVRVPSARHVLLEVNGVISGLTLEYEDPDNKTWLAAKFGDDGGDLYKAARDLPDQDRYFATLEYLGDADSDYDDHYRKMTNNDDPLKALDVSTLRSFLLELNQTSDGEFPDWLKAHFDVEKFVSYLVVGNFISHWDSLPERPKNFWLYQIPAAGGRFVFVPWDMDGTFQPWEDAFNIMGTDASVFFEFDAFEEYPGRLPEEGTARPLTTRMMRVPELRDAYLSRYRQALSSFLAETYLLSRIDDLEALLLPVTPAADLESLTDSTQQIRDFVTQRTASVTAELARL
jgi:spore coat protein CotH